MTLRQMILVREESKNIGEGKGTDYLRGYLCAVRTIQGEHPELFAELQELLQEVFGREEWISYKKEADE